MKGTFGRRLEFNLKKRRKGEDKLFLLLGDKTINKLNTTVVIIAFLNLIAAIVMTVSNRL